MNQQVEAVYEHGILRPLQPLTLTESQLVQLTISDAKTESYPRNTEFLDRVKAEVAAMANVPSLEDVQRLMSKIPGSLTEDFSAEREE